MKYTIPFIVLIIAAPVLSFAQAPAIMWERCLGGSATESGSSIKQTADQGYIICGSAFSTDGDVTGYHVNSAEPDNADVWVVKLDVNGHLQWQKCLGGLGDDNGSCVVQTYDGGYIVSSTSTSDDNDVSGNHGGYDMWVVKLSNTGTIEWQKSLGGPGADYGYSIIQTADSGYMATGQTFSSGGDVSGYHGGTAQYGDGWVVKMDKTGAVQWQKCLGGTGGDFANCVQQTNDGGYIVAGLTNSTNGDVAGLHGTATDAWIVKMSSGGAIQWQKCLGGTDNDWATYIIQTGDNGYVMTGAASSADGDVSGVHGAAATDVWVVKTDAAGVLQWQKCFGGTADDIGWQIQQTTDGGYVLAGATNSFDGDVSVYGGNGDAWILKLTATGGLQWEKTIGSADADVAYSIVQSIDGGCTVTGETLSSDPYFPDNHGQGDAFVLKLGGNETGVLSPFADQARLVYPNPANNTISAGDNAVCMRLTDLAGKPIQSTKGNELNIAAVVPGTYLLQVTYSNGTNISNKIIVTR